MIYYRDFKFYHRRRWLGDGELNLLTFCENLAVCPFSITGEDAFITRLKWVKRKTGVLNFMLEVCDSASYGSYTYKSDCRESGNELLLTAIARARESKLVNVSYRTERFHMFAIFDFDGIDKEYNHKHYMGFRPYRIEVAFNHNFDIDVVGHLMASWTLSLDRLQLLHSMRQKNLKEFFGELGIVDMVKAQRVLGAL